MKIGFFSYSCAAALALAAGLTARAAGEFSLPIDTNQAAAVLNFDASRTQIVTDEVAQASAFALDYVRGKADQTVLTTKQTFQPPAVLEAEVRLPGKVSAMKPNTIYRGSATVGFVATGVENTNPVHSAVTMNRARFVNDYAYSVGSSAGGQGSGLNITPGYTLADVTPLMDENLRQVLERTVQRLPIVDQRIHRLRVEMREDSTRMFVDGRLAGSYKVTNSAANATVTLNSDARLLSLRVRPLEPVAKAFDLMPLDDFCNAKDGGKVEGLPEPGRIGTIQGIPFIASAGFRGEDHLDLAPSIFALRLATMRECDPRQVVENPEEVDVNRFTLRTPGQPYRRAWVLAAYDGDPNATPILTVRFYKPRSSFSINATATVPSYQATSAPAQAKRVALKRADGKSESVWLIPIELDAAALAADPMAALELTKQIYNYRGWPDPAYYNAIPGGLPSGVHVYGLTLEAAPLWARGTGTSTGSLYTEPETPKWRVLMRNLTAAPLEVNVTVTATDPYGKAGELKQKVKLPADKEQHEISFDPPAKVFGLYTVQTTIDAGDFRQTRSGTFLRLPKSTRKATSVNSPWGLWGWSGGHGTEPSLKENIRMLKALGAVNNFDLTGRLDPDPKKPPVSLYDLRHEEGIGPMHYRLVGRAMPAWSTKDPYDPAEYAAFAEEKGKEAAAQLKLHPDLQYVNFFGENAVSLRLTHGMPPSAMGQPWFTYDAKEAQLIRSYWVTAKAAAEGVRKYAPSLKIIFGHCAADFEQPFFLLPDWKNDLFDGFGMDLPQFERMPERQPRATEPSLLYFLHKQMKDKGLLGKEIVHLESYFPPTGPMALSDDEQAEIVARTAVLSSALGTTRFMRTWGLQVCSDGWGNSHYGSCGLIDREPEGNPKPGAETFATMTQVLDLSKYDGWVDTGSRSAYCVRFKDTDRLVYAVWTIRGTRPLELTLDGDATRTDSHGNAFPLKAKDGHAAVTLSSNPQWIEVRKGSIKAATVGEPVYTEAPAPNRKVLADFESGDWKYDTNTFERYQNNHWDMPREPGKMQAERVRSEQRTSTVFRVQLTGVDTNKPMVGFYGVFTPPKPIEIPGKAKAFGVWVNGHSAWNRILYEITDAKGEKWISAGTHDQWNCDDVHSWMSANFDGWRYLTFPLPGNAPSDNFREADSTWWGADAEGIVDLPVKLTKIMVEMRPKMVYIDEMLPIKDLSLELDDLSAEYADAQDMTDAPVKSQQSAAAALKQKELPPLANPYAELQKTGAGAAPKIEKMYPPEQNYNGTRLYVEVQPMEGAARYKGYVAAYPDGRGAQALAIDQKSPGYWATTCKTPNVLFFDKLRPATPLYYFVTTVDADGKESKPSAIREVLLKDEFPFK